MVRTPNRLTVMLPVVQPKPYTLTVLEEAAADEVGHKLVHAIFVRKGMKRLTGKSGQLKPLARTIFSKNMERLRAHEDPALIVRDLESQLLLV